jgi:hypothetical protein
MMSEVNRLISTIKLPKDGLFLKRFVGNDYYQLVFYPDPKIAVARLRITSVVRIVCEQTDIDVVNEKRMTHL